MLRIKPIFHGNAGTETAERIFNKVIATYNAASTTPFYEQRLDLRRQARDLSRSEEASLESMRAGVASINLAQNLERLGKSRKENARTLTLADLGPHSLRTIFNDMQDENQAYVPAAAALSITYYQQQINQWQSSIKTVRDDLKLTENFKLAIQEVYPAIEKHWNSLTVDQKRFITHAIEQFQQAENEYNKNPLVSKKIILRQRAAKLIAVMTQADDRYGVGLRHGIPEDWLNGHKKEELLHQAKQAIKLADNLALPDKRCAEIDAAYEARVVGPTWEQRQEQEKLFYQHYLAAYKAAAKKIAYRQADLRTAGLELEYACQLLSRPYRDEIQYYRSVSDVKKHQEKHKK
jgi:hypothetical protein